MLMEKELKSIRYKVPRIYANVKYLYTQHYIHYLKNHTSLRTLGSSPLHGRRKWGDISDNEENNLKKMSRELQLMITLNL